MMIGCPGFQSPKNDPSLPNPHRVVRKGFFRRKSDSRWIQRFLCRTCGYQFSRSTFSPRYYQKLRRINAPLFRLLVSGVSQSRAAVILKVDPKTVARRFVFLANEARRSQEQYLTCVPEESLKAIQFDDLESSIHTKCKPVSVALAVEPKFRKILGFEVNQMPAKGPLAKLALAKYGIRKDHRARGWDQLFKRISPFLAIDCEVTSDENPHYPPWVHKHLPTATHVRIPGGRGAITGQGELRDKRFDPMFALNHTCAMFRANINRLFRRTWCTSKKIERLRDHIALYVDFHNRVLTDPYPESPYPIFGGS
jgi:transposase-like protein